jgi:NADH-quinone oxidoreductase subunit N
VKEELGPLTPELILAASAVAGLLAGSWLPRGRQWAVRLLAAAACLATLATTAFTPAGATTTDFGGSYAIDAATDAVRVVVAGATLVVICLSGDAMRAHKRETEFYVLLQLAALGTIVLAGANDLLLLFAGYLLASVPGYALAGFRKDAAGTEAALKYYLMGALFGVAMLTGITLLYGAGRTTGYPALPATLTAAPHGVVAVGVIAVVAGLMFKAGGVPAHFWVPDVTEGTSAPVAAFVTTVPKIGALVALFRLLAVAIPTAAVNWPMLVAVLAAASMTLGNLAAFFQTSVKRLLAYSTISQVGYLLMAVAVATTSSTALRALLFYLAAYAATNLAAFAVVAELPHALTPIFTKRIGPQSGQSYW